MELGGLEPPTSWVRCWGKGRTPLEGAARFGSGVRDLGARRRRVRRRGTPLLATNLPRQHR